MSFSESGSLGNSSASDVTSLSSQLPDTPNSMVHSPIDTWRGQERSGRGPPGLWRLPQDALECQSHSVKKKEQKNQNGLYIYQRNDSEADYCFHIHVCVGLELMVDILGILTPKWDLISALWDLSAELHRTLKVTGSRPQTSTDQERRETNCVDRCAWFVSFSMDETHVMRTVLFQQISYYYLLQQT